MRAKPSAAMIAGVVVGLLVYALAGYFLLVSPQRKKASELKSQAAATEQQIDTYRALAAQARATPPIRVADLFRLTKAMPDRLDMPGLLLELSRVARESGIEFDSITPQGAAPVADYSSVSIALEFDGNYYELSDFLFRLRNLVRVRTGRLDALGRLFVVDSIGFAESERSFPRIKASLVVYAFAYGDVTTPPVAAPAVPATGSSTTSTETTQTTTTGSTETPPPATPNTPPEAPSGSTASGAGEP